MTLHLIPQTLLLMILIYVVTYVHIVTSDFHDIGHEKTHVVQHYAVSSDKNFFLHTYNQILPIG